MVGTWLCYSMVRLRRPNNLHWCGKQRRDQLVRSIHIDVRRECSLSASAAWSRLNHDLEGMHLQGARPQWNPYLLHWWSRKEPNFFQLRLHRLWILGDKREIGEDAPFDDYTWMVKFQDKSWCKCASAWWAPRLWPKELRLKRSWEEISLAWRCRRRQEEGGRARLPFQILVVHPHSIHGSA